MQKKHRHFKIFKPYGYLSQFITNQSKAKKKKMLGDLHDFPEGTMSVGRLDEASEGLLILTTDGKTSAAITGRATEKEYYAQVDGIITPEAIESLQKGVNISVQGSNYKTLPCKAEVLQSIPSLPARAKKIRDERHGPSSWITITLTEGKYRQVRKMTAAVGFPTLRLVRVRVGDVTIQNMQAGEIIEITDSLKI